MKIDAAKFIADMIKVHGGECPKVWQDTLAMQGLKVENGEIVSIEPEQDCHLTGIGSKEATGKLKEIIDKVKQDKQNTDNLHQYLYGTLTEFEQCLKSGTNIYVEQGRHMEDWDAKQDAKELLSIFNKEHQAELAESKDEKIRKEIAVMVNFFYGTNLAFKHSFSKNEMLAWLEKQKGTEREIEGNSICNGEQKPVEWSQEDAEDSKAKESKVLGSRIQS